MNIRSCALLLALYTGTTSAADPFLFWQSPQYGGNSFNRLPPDAEYFQALHGYGATWVRLAWDKWPTTQRDFLLGSADRYQGLNVPDLQTLLTTLDAASAAGLKVVLTPLTLPGARWIQHNDGRFDDRLWQDKAYWRQAADFWRDLARALKGNPAVAGYNIINEPAPEKMGGLAEHASQNEMQRWVVKNQGSARDLRAFYTQVIAAIREVDPTTPVMVDGGWYAAADGFDTLQKPLEDPRVLYSFHMYEPYAATSAPNLKRKTPWSYPGIVPFAGKKEMWDAVRVSRYMQTFFDWAEKQNIPATHLVAGEFGCVRQLPGCTQYLNDVLAVLDKKKVHWAFYSFREDSWDGMDYELGKENVPWSYWQAAERGERDTLARKATPEFEPVRERLAQMKK